MKGDVHPSGVITTSITIKDIGGYEYPVSLSATGQPSGVEVTFVPSFGRPKPSYTSTVTINVDPSVSVGNYSIVMKGTGADGKEHSCCYNLRVKPTGTPTPTPMSTPASPSGLMITFSQYPTKVTRGTRINFNWKIAKEPPSSSAGESFHHK